MAQNSSTARKTVKVAAAEAPVGRRERNKAEKHARIVAAARHLFHTQGFAETTTLQIAEAADIGTGTLFLYARSKEALLVLVFKDEMMEVALDSFTKSPAKGPLAQQALAVFERMVDYHARDIDLSRQLIREITIPADAEKRSAMDDLTTLIFAGLARMVADAQARGEVPSGLDPELTGHSMFAIYYFNLLQWLSGRIDRERLGQQLRRELESLLRNT